MKLFRGNLRITKHWDEELVTGSYYRLTSNEQDFETACYFK